MKYSRVLFWIVIILAFILRFWQLGNIPESASNDEAAYIYSGYSIWETGRDIAGVKFPLSINLDNSFSPVPVYIIAPFVGIFELNAFWGRLPFALAGFGSVVIFYFIVRELLKERIALLATFAFAISPWHLHLSRTTLDAVLALFFFLLGFYIFLKTYKKGSILWSFPSFFLAFYSYHGTKLFLLLFIPFLVWCFKEPILKRKKELGVFIALCLLMIGSFYYVSKTQQVTRQQVFFWNDKVEPAKVVNKEREQSDAPQLLKKVFSNKVLYFGRRARENYLEAFSPEYLFMYGEQSGVSTQYGTTERGVLYLIELPLLLFGAYYLFSKKRTVFWLILGGLLLAPLPSAFTGDRSFVIRSIMMLPFLMIIVGSGIYAFILFAHSKKDIYRYGLLGGLMAAYGLFVTLYLYQYYFRYPTYSSESWFYSTKEISDYLGQNKGKYKNVSITYGTPMILPAYGFYNKTDPAKIQYAWADFQNRKFDGITYVHVCPGDSKGPADPNVFLPPSSMYVVPYDCYPYAKPAFTIQDRGEVLQTRWRIFIKQND